MMYSLNKLVGALINPTILATTMTLLALVLLLLRRRRLASGLLLGGIVWIWLMATPLMGRLLGVPLEKPFWVNDNAPALESYPTAEAIVLHGGSMGWAGEYADMWTSADRVWMAVKLWKAKKAPLIYATGTGVTQSTAGILKDFGVPTNAVVFAAAPRNTEEEAKFIGQVFSEKRVLVVTSAWHLRRTLMMYRQYAPRVQAIPAPCDFENMMKVAHGFSLAELFPHDESLLANRVALHEWVGIAGYRVKGWLHK